jgi:protein gp37
VNQAALLGLKHAIGWCDLTVNYGVYGCQMVSPACGTADGSSMCYASKTAERLIEFAHGGGPYAGLVRDGRWTGEVRTDPARIAAAFATLPKRLRADGRQTRAFGSMFDLFHEDVPFSFIDAVFVEMAARPWIAFQVLTKRAERLAEYAAHRTRRDLSWPANIWAGVTVEDQRRAERIAYLLQVPAEVRFLSVEPCLSGIDLTEINLSDYQLHNALTGDGSIWHDPVDGVHGGGCEEYEGGPTISWVIIGSESDGPRPGARETRDEWVLDLVDQCDAAGVPVFLKQLAIGGRLCSLPMVDGRVRAEFPR